MDKRPKGLRCPYSLSAPGHAPLPPGAIANIINGMVQRDSSGTE
jgi:hypothetical protein